MPFDQRQALEKLEVLDGSRAGAAEQAAVRIADLAELLQLASVRTTEVAVAPTATDFNALLADLKEINKRLSVVANVLQSKILR